VNTGGVFSETEPLFPPTLPFSLTGFALLVILQPGLSREQPRISATGAGSPGRGPRF
jgi:hypothetical protein